MSSSDRQGSKMLPVTSSDKEDGWQSFERRRLLPLYRYLLTCLALYAVLATAFVFLPTRHVDDSDGGNEWKRSAGRGTSGTDRQSEKDSLRYLRVIANAIEQKQQQQQQHERNATGHSVVKRQTADCQDCLDRCPQAAPGTQTPAVAVTSPTPLPKPAAFVVPTIRYQWEEDRFVMSKLRWHKNHTRAFSRGVKLNETHLIILSDGLYHVSGQFAFDDFRTSQNSAKLYVNTTMVAKSMSPNPLVWGHDNDSRPVFVQRQVQKLNSSGADSLPIASTDHGIPDQTNAFMRTLQVQALLRLKRGDALKLRPGCVRPGGKCKPAVRSFSSTAPLNYMALFMVE